MTLLNIHRSSEVFTSYFDLQLGKQRSLNYF